jgi:IclR family pca regulon transcriptional regulator
MPVDPAMSRSLERGLEVLALFEPGRPAIGVSEIGRALDLPRSTAYRYVATLATLGYLEQDESKRYRLGLRVLDLGFSAINSLDVRALATPHLQQLCDETGYTTNLAILDGCNIVYIERCLAAMPERRELDLNLHIGARLPAYCTSMGKAMLAFLPEEQRIRILDQLELVKRGPNTITDKAALQTELSIIRENGIAINDEELAYGLWSVAAPICARTGSVVAALNIALRRSIAGSDELVARIAPALVRTAAAISSQIA